jgi:hypothetical protein
MPIPADDYSTPALLARRCRRVRVRHSVGVQASSVLEAAALGRKMIRDTSALDHENTLDIIAETRTVYAASAVLDGALKQVVATYKAEMDAMRAALAKREADTPDVVVAATLRALNDKKPKPRVVVGKGAGRLAKLRYLPGRRRDRMLLNAFGMAKLRG